MAGVRGGKARNLDIVSYQVPGSGKSVGSPFKKLFLMIPTRSPREYRSDVQVLPLDLSQDVFRVDSLLRVFIVTTARSVNMMISAVPSEFGQVGPPRELETHFVGFHISGNRNRAGLCQILGTSREGYFIVSRWNVDMLSILPIDLRVEVKVGGTRHLAPADETARGR